MTDRDPADTVPTLLDVHQGLYAFDKPSGWKTHPGTGGGPDVATWLDAHPDLPPGLAPVHRLDRGASGILLCAAEPIVRHAIAQAFEKGDVRKAYLALVHGRMRSKGVVRAALVESGHKQEAVTRWRRLELLGPVTLVSVKPDQGRRHQIRRHLAGLGHALVGDDRYRRPKTWAVPGAPSRLWLHARGLTWGDWSVSSPLPPELETHLALLRARVEAVPADT